MDAKIDLRVGLRSGRSVMRSLYVSPPFRVVSVGQLESDGAAYLMQMSTSPGVLSGDNYDLNFEVEDGASLQMKSQSYQRIYDMDGEARQTMRIKIGDGARYSQVAHPIVPHRNSAFFSKTEVVMGANSSFLQSEIITCGRKHHGEEFEFREFSNTVEVRHSGVLRLKDRVWLSPKQMPISECGLLEGETHQGTLVYQTTVESEDVSTTIEAIHTMLSEHRNIRFAISATHYSGFVIRLLGGGGEALFSAFTDVQNYIWKELKQSIC